MGRAAWDRGALTRPNDEIPLEGSSQPADIQVCEDKGLCNCERADVVPGEGPKC